jgi:hypothetical protein
VAGGHVGGTAGLDGEADADDARGIGSSESVSVSTAVSSADNSR